MKATGIATALSKAEWDLDTLKVCWDDETIKILLKARELYNNAGRKVTRELKMFLKDAKAHFNKGPGNPHGRMTWKQFCHDFTEGTRCKETIDNWIDSLDDEILSPIVEEVLQVEGQPVAIKDSKAQVERKPKGSGSTETKAPRKMPIKFFEVERPDDGLIIKNLSQDRLDESYTMRFSLQEYPGLIFGVVFDAPEEPRQMPDCVAELMESARVWAAKGFPTEASVFSGWGGIPYCLRERGYIGVMANEWDPDDTSQNAFQNLAKMFPEMRDANVLLNKDIWKISLEDILAVMAVFGIAPGDLDFFQFSPVCTGFSGKNRLKENLMKADMIDRDDNVINLYKPAINLIKILLPKFVLMENVRGLCDDISLPKLLEIKKDLEDAGYYVKWRVLRACDVGAPQTRPRLWMIGVRMDLGVMPSFPDAMRKNVGVVDVLPNVEFFRLEGVVTVTEPVLDKDGKQVRDENGKLLRRVQKFTDVDGVEKSVTACHPIRSSVNPCGTILKSAGINLKDFGSDTWRKATNEELLKLFTFPPELAKDFIGTPEQVRERLGNSVIRLQVHLLMDHIEKLAKSIPVPSGQEVA